MVEYDDDDDMINTEFIKICDYSYRSWNIILKIKLAQDYETKLLTNSDELKTTQADN